MARPRHRLKLNLSDHAAYAASRDLAQVTNDRDSVLVKKGWVTPQQGDTDRLTLNAQQAAIAVAQANIAAQQALIRVLRQQKA
jgi:multidrug resistance efflux pump